MNCPNCNARLDTIEYEGVHVETCSRCEGEWLDAAELGNIVRVREKRFDPQEQRALAAATKITGIKVADHDRDLVCPKCEGQTDAIHYGGDSGILIDKCTECGGVWLDGSELEKIQMLVEGWKDNLPQDLKKHSAKLHQVNVDLHANTKVKISRVRFVNTLINGILDRVL